ncbi:unnamed protein product [Clavelina lepadiformis]|uniref:Uncharacterized protein n=1 Tax=Clavelina lepadiformis TaxID=159417 RepID=A0ABP0F0S1_CLALP
MKGLWLSVSCGFMLLTTVVVLLTCKIHRSRKCSCCLTAPHNETDPLLPGATMTSASSTTSPSPSMVRRLQQFRDRIKKIEEEEGAKDYDDIIENKPDYPNSKPCYRDAVHSLIGRITVSYECAPTTSRGEDRASLLETLNLKSKDEDVLTSQNTVQLDDFDSNKMPFESSGNLAPICEGHDADNQSFITEMDFAYGRWRPPANFVYSRTSTVFTDASCESEVELIRALSLTDLNEENEDNYLGFESAESSESNASEKLSYYPEGDPSQANGTNGLFDERLCVPSSPSGDRNELKPSDTYTVCQRDFSIAYKYDAKPKKN